jgi:hypothetical protein
MNRALRRHQQRMARFRRVRILIGHGFFRWRSGRQQKWKELSRLVMNEPGWWTHEMVIAPSRIESHRLERQIERGLEPDLFLWPDYRRPHIYYW